MVLSRAESLRVHPKRHAFTMHYKTGARRDGTITAMEAVIVGDGGAYASESVPVMRTAIGMSSGPYAMVNVALDSYVAYTNNPTAGAMRGFGIPQVIFAVESQMDRLARALGIDPFEIRLRNALDLGKICSTGQVLRERTVFPEVLKAVRAAAQHLPAPQPGKRRGVGVACGIKSTGLGFGRDPGAGAVVEVTQTGEILVRVGMVELGQGLETMVAQVAAQCLGVDYGQIRVIAGDTAETPPGGPTIASRGTYMAGSAVYQAAHALRSQLISRAAEAFAIPMERILFEDGRFVDRGSEEVRGTLAELARTARERGWDLSERTHFLPPVTHPLRKLDGPDTQPDAVQPDTHFGLAFTTEVAVVDVDEATADVQVVKLIIGHDGGRVIHPQNVENQLEGGAIMGMGYGLSEVYHAYGPQRTDTLRKCRVPDIAQAPDVEILLVESNSMVGPSGGKAVGEAGLSPAAPAIVNAIYDAVGVRITSLPATREVIRAGLAALRAADSQHIA
jgi:CO/xanthine dehydrogenase Mo-binding subunit